MFITSRTTSILSAIRVSSPNHRPARTRPGAATPHAAVPDDDRRLDAHDRVALLFPEGSTRACISRRAQPRPARPRPIAYAADRSPGAAGHTDRLQELQAAISTRLELGDTLDTVERELIAPSELPEDEKSALWVYAWSHPERPRLSQCQPRLSAWAALVNALAVLVGIYRY
jgi:hypothetical protein